MVQFRSFEETLALAGALAVGLLAYKLFKTTAFTSILVGMLSGFVLAYTTFFEFTLLDDKVTYRNRFRQISFPLSWVERVTMRTFWVGLPGHTFMFRMRPPAPWSGYFLRIGLVSWPSASQWVASVNAAIQSRQGGRKPSAMKDGSDLHD